MNSKMFTLTQLSPLATLEVASDKMTLTDRPARPVVLRTLRMVHQVELAVEPAVALDKMTQYGSLFK